MAEPVTGQGASEAPWVNSSSTCLESYRFDAVNYAEGILEVRFHSGKVYPYRIPAAVYDGLRAAASKGQYYNRVIKGRFGV